MATIPQLVAMGKGTRHTAARCLDACSRTIERVLTRHFRVEWGQFAVPVDDLVTVVADRPHTLLSLNPTSRTEPQRNVDAHQRCTAWAHSAGSRISGGSETVTAIGTPCASESPAN